MQKIRIIGLVKNIALVAHDHKKADLIDWVNSRKDLLTPHHLVATGTTGSMLEESLGISVKKVLSGPLGGDQQLGAMIAEGKLDLIIFFWDPLEAQAHDSDVKALLRVATAWNILIACDRSTADFVLTSPLMNSDYHMHIPDYSGYLNREVPADK